MKFVIPLDLVKKKKHRVSGVYMTLANFRPHHRSLVDNTLLVMLCKEVDLREFGQYKVFGKLVEDLKDLERNGILVNNELVKGSVCFLTGFITWVHMV